MEQGLIQGIYRSLRVPDEEFDREGWIEQTRDRLGLARQYLRTYSLSHSRVEPFQDLKTYCIFLGHARSGSSLLGALLDAHPNAIIADEVDIFPYLSAGFSRNQIFHMLLDKSRLQAEKGRTKPGRDSKQYSYRVPGQWQGRFNRLLVIGNRKAGITTQKLGRHPESILRLRDTLGDLHLKLILSLRNPFDTISTMAIRNGRTLEQGTERYFKNCETIRQLQSILPAQDFLLIRHEKFLANPKSYLRELCQFLGLPAPEDYVQACADILYHSPSQSRHQVIWRESFISSVESRISGYEFLRGYSYDQ